MAYATAVDLDEWVGEDLTLPSAEEQDRLLERASTDIDSVLLEAVYDVDSSGNPTDPDVAQAISDATCAQVEWWLESGDEFGTAGQWDDVAIGSVRLARGGGQGSNRTPPSVAPRAVRRLQLAGLLPNNVLTGQG